MERRSEAGTGQVKRTLPARLSIVRGGTLGVWVWEGGKDGGLGGEWSGSRP